MREYLILRVSEILEQHELVEFLESRFPHATREIGKTQAKGTKCVEVRVPADSPEFKEISRFVNSKRALGLKAFAHFPIASYLRKYRKDELQNAEALLLKISAHFEPSGEECGTVYETICKECNMGRQASELVLDLRTAPQNRDMAETISWVEWIISSRLARMFMQNGFSGAEFRPIFEFRYPTKQSEEWSQLWVTGRAGRLARETQLGKDPFAPAEIEWRCPLGHSVVTSFLSEVYLHPTEWDGSDIATTSNLFGQGRNLLRPTPLIIISQRLYLALISMGAKGFSAEPVHFVD
jgi:hypothetical protein